MAGRSDGSAIKALFPPSKDDPPHLQKRKPNHPPPKMTLPLTKVLYHYLPLKIPLHLEKIVSPPPLTKMPLLLTKIRKTAHC